MSYDKQTPGWGQGDTRRACRLAKGNCTDFHSLFISLARAQGIPCRFDIGFQIPSVRRQPPIEGYHCWAEYWSREEGWVPVDASEASKHPDRRAFYLGTLDENRIRMSTGRDVRSPGMHGEPLNYFIFPYGEVDGKPVDHVRHANTSRDE
jgi:transglutaminase-like putative cysteine protease